MPSTVKRFLQAHGMLDAPRALLFVWPAGQSAWRQRQRSGAPSWLLARPRTDGVEDPQGLSCHQVATKAARGKGDSSNSDSGTSGNGFGSGGSSGKPKSHRSSVVATSVGAASICCIQQPSWRWRCTADVGGCGSVTALSSRTLGCMVQRKWCGAHALCFQCCCQL